MIPSSHSPCEQEEDDGIDSMSPMLQHPAVPGALGVTLACLFRVVAAGAPGIMFERTGVCCHGLVESWVLGIDYIVLAIALREGCMVMMRMMMLISGIKSRISCMCKGGRRHLGGVRGHAGWCTKREYPSSSLVYCSSPAALSTRRFQRNRWESIRQCGGRTNCEPEPWTQGVRPS